MPYSTSGALPQNAVNKKQCLLVSLETFSKDLQTCFCLFVIMAYSTSGALSQNVVNKKQCLLARLETISKNFDH